MRIHRPPGTEKEKTPVSKIKREADALYKTAEWQGLRRVILSMSPVCRMCLSDSGVYTEAKVVDHIEPHRGDPKLFWDKENLQPLCKPCHDAKTALETRSAPVVPQFNDTPSRVVLVCGPPGSGRLTYAQDRAGAADSIVDVESMAQELSGEDRYKAEEKHRKQAYGQAVSAIRQHIRDGVSVLYVCLELPQATARRQWKEQLGDECSVVVLERSVDDIASDEPEAERLAIKWWNKYTRAADIDGMMNI